MSHTPRFVAVVLFALALTGGAGCAETTENSTFSRERDRNANVQHQQPASQSTAASSTGKGRGGEHKSMMHHH